MIVSSADASVAAPILEVEKMVTRFPVARTGWREPRRVVHAVEDVSFSIGPGEVVGLVGESGSGKSTIGRTILRFVEPTSGRVAFEGVDLLALDPKAMRAVRRRMQVIFQDPYASLNPRMRVEDLVGEGLRTHGIGTKHDRRARVAALLEQVGLPADTMGRYPHQFSGGQRQRIGIARALAVEPRFILADEPVSALDVSVQAQVLNLLQDLQEDLGLTMLFIAHDLAVVEHFCDRVIVLYLGRIMESAPSRELYRGPRHPYTEALLSSAAVPEVDATRQRIILAGEVPSPIDPPSGCVFRTRCRHALPECAVAVPALREVAPNHFKACIRDDVL